MKSYCFIVGFQWKIFILESNADSSKFAAVDISAEMALEIEGIIARGSTGCDLLLETEEIFLIFSS